MSFVVFLALVPAAVVGGLAYWLARRRAWVGLAAAVLVFAAIAAWLLHPACREITAEDLARFDPPIETRSDTDMLGRPAFQRRDGGWYQCKTWIAREMFF